MSSLSFSTDRECGHESRLSSVFITLMLPSFTLLIKTSRSIAELFDRGVRSPLGLPVCWKKRNRHILLAWCCVILVNRCVIGFLLDGVIFFLLITMAGKTRLDVLDEYAKLIIVRQHVGYPDVYPFHWYWFYIRSLSNVIRKWNYDFSFNRSLCDKHMAFAYITAAKLLSDSGSNYKSGILMLHIWSNMSHKIVLVGDSSEQTMLHANSKMQIAYDW